MARYIDADKIHQFVNENFKDDVPYEWAWTLTAIDHQPTADVVEVVRCKDCKGCELRYPAKAIGEEAIEEYYCHPNQRYVKSTDFCSYGERRET